MRSRFNTYCAWLGVVPVEQRNSRLENISLAWSGRFLLKAS
jgi:hypothetical protein